jgi:uncharacterized protein (DUF885 family)
MPTPDTAVNAIADRFWERLLRESPTTATVYGDERYSDLLDDPGPAGRAAARELRERTLAELEAIPAGGLPVEERITRDMIDVVCHLGLEQADARMDLLAAVDQMGGPQALLPQLVQFQPADTPERLDRLVARLEAYGPFMDSYVGLLDEGRASGLTAPRIAVDRTVAQTERLLAIPAAASPIVASAQLADGDTDGRERLAAAVEAHVRPALGRYLEALRGDYRAAAREEPGLWSAPNGDALYRLAMRSWTTLELDPVELHQVGLDELAEINAERRTIARGAGFGDDFDAYRWHIQADPANVAASAEALVARAREDIGRALAAAPSWFGRLPVSTCDVRPVDAFMEKDAPFAYYFPPAVDGSRPGIYYVNTYDLPHRYFSTLGTTTYHEAVPGHHFQIALEMEHPDLPAFRRLGSRLVGGAYAEGWGLYSERLAGEMGLFRNDAERFGMLTAQAWRAGRLIVDTGIHALRRDRAWGVRVLLDAGLTETDASIETDRYITWPGQALTYKVGQREIERLRRELTARDGAAFDVRAFHDAVLGHGSLPLATLARELPTWLAVPAR